MRIRDILRQSHGAFRQDWLSDKFRYDQDRARELADGLEAAGYVQRDRERELRSKSTFPWYSVTDKGDELTRASAAKRITRRTAAAALEEFMKRVHNVNASSKYLYSVQYVAVFGSFLLHRARLGDIDVAVDLKSRVALDEKHKWVEIFRRHAWRSEKTFSTWDEEVDWPRREVLLALKSRKRSISIRPWFSFVEMVKAKNFRYKVLLGDLNEIGRDLTRPDASENRDRISQTCLSHDR